jgi:hypothetical protein
VREEQVRAHVAGELAEVLIVPRRLDAAQRTWGRLGVIPADTEPIPVRSFRAAARVQALVDQQMRRRVKRILN